jgi:hypothetical protein
MAMTGYINTSRSVPLYATWIDDSLNNNSPSHFDGRPLKHSVENYLKANKTMWTHFKEYKGLKPSYLAVTQGLTPLPQYVSVLTPKILNKLLNKYDKGIIAGIYNGMIEGNTPTHPHAVLLTGVKGNTVIYNDPNYRKKQKIPIDKLNDALMSRRYSLLGKENTPVLSTITTNRYTSGVNLKDTPNDKIRQHIIDAEQRHIAFIENDTNTSRSEIFKETLDFRSLLAQVDEVVRPRHNKAVEAGLVESRLAKLEGINDASLPLTDSTMSQTNEKLINNITTKNNIYKYTAGRFK